MSSPFASIGRAAQYVLLSIAAFVSVFPFIWMVLGATNRSPDIIKGKATPGDALFENIAKFLAQIDLPRVLFNSLLIAGVGSILTLIVASMAGYGFEMFRSRLRERVFSLLLLMLSIPFAALMIPLFIMMANL